MTCHLFLSGGKQQGWKVLGDGEDKRAGYPAVAFRGPGFDRGCAGHSDSGTGVSPLSSLLPCQCHYTVAVTTKTSGRSLKTFQKTAIFRHTGTVTKDKYLLCFGGRISGLRVSLVVLKKAVSGVVMFVPLCFAR